MTTINVGDKVLVQYEATVTEIDRRDRIRVQNNELDPGHWDEFHPNDVGTLLTVTERTLLDWPIGTILQHTDAGRLYHRKVDGNWATISGHPWEGGNDSNEIVTTLRNPKIIAERYTVIYDPRVLA